MYTVREEILLSTSKKEPSAFSESSLSPFFPSKPASRGPGDNLRGAVQDGASAPIESSTESRPVRWLRERTKEASCFPKNWAVVFSKMHISWSWVGLLNQNVNKGSIANYNMTMSLPLDHQPWAPWKGRQYTVWSAKQLLVGNINVQTSVFESPRLGCCPWPPCESPPKRTR